MKHRPDPRLDGLERPKRTSLESDVAHAERQLGLALREFSQSTLGTRAA